MKSKINLEDDTKINCSTTFYSHYPEWVIKRLEKENDELREKIKSLEKLLKEYTDLHSDNNLSYIDGHYCYREINDIKFESVKMKDDLSGLHFIAMCSIIYKDVETHDIIAKRYMKESVDEMPKRSVCDV